MWTWADPLTKPICFMGFDKLFFAYHFTPSYYPLFPRVSFYHRHELLLSQYVPAVSLMSGFGGNASFAIPWLRFLLLTTIMGRSRKCVYNPFGRVLSVLNTIGISLQGEWPRELTFPPTLLSLIFTSSSAPFLRLLGIQVRAA